MNVYQMNNYYYYFQFLLNWQVFQSCSKSGWLNFRELFKQSIL